VIVLALITIAVIIAIFRVWSPWRPRVQGPVVHVLRMPIRARLVNQVVPVVLLIGAVVLNEALGRLPFWVPLVPLVLLVATSLIPARYTLTTDGIAVGALGFRRWTEFSGVTIRRGQVRCKPISGVRGLSIWLPGRFHDADTVIEVRRLIRDAYQGRSVRASTAAESESDGSLVTI
jgi:ABC-type xylose transport system permease subunit